MTEQQYPVFETVGAGYKYADLWGGHLIEASIGRVITEKSSKKAKIAIRMDGRPVIRSWPTLTSVDGVDKFWKKLARRRPFDDYGIDWEECVEQMSGMILDTHDQFIPSVKLKDIPEAGPISYLVDPFVIESEINVLYGDSGNGKSMLALLWACLLDTDATDSAHRIVTKPAKVMYLDYETDEQQVRRRASWIHKGMGIEDVESNILYKRCVQPLHVMAEALKDEVEAEGIEFVIVDSLGMALGGSLIDEQAVIGYFSVLRFLDVTSLTVTHTNKKGEIHGSVFTNAQSRQTFEAKRAGGEKNKIDVALFHRKVNDVSKLDPRAYELRFAPGEVKFIAKDVMDSEVGAEGLSISALVREVLKIEGPTPRDQLPELVAEYRETDVEKIRAAVMTAVSRHIKARRVVEMGDKVMLPNATAKIVETKDEKPEEPKEGDQWTL